MPWNNLELEHILYEWKTTVSPIWLAYFAPLSLSLYYIFVVRSSTNKWLCACICCCVSKIMNLMIAQRGKFLYVYLLWQQITCEKNLTHFADISGLGAYFSKSIFVLKSLVQASGFEYHKPYKQNNLFLSYKGSFRILKRKSSLFQ